MAAAGCDLPPVLPAPEAELYVQGLREFSVADVGSPKWVTQHERMEKLNMQAHQNVRLDAEEFVTELFLTHCKVPLLIHELLASEVWYTRVFPRLPRTVADEHALTLYMFFFHEATVVSLLEVLFFKKDAVLAAGDSLLDLIDYCARKITFLTTWEEPEESSEKTMADMLRTSENERLAAQRRDLDFRIAITTLSLYRYITDYVDELSLSALTRLLNTHDAPCSLVYLMERAPWARRRQSDGALQRFQDGEWKTVTGDERLRLQKVEAQVWIALYNILTEPECRRKYPYDSHNIEVVRRLKNYMTDTLIDQIPNLERLQRALEELVLMPPPPPSAVNAGNSIQQLPEVLEGICRLQDWEAIADGQAKTVFAEQGETKRRVAQSLAATYNLDHLEMLLDDPRCAKCGCLAAHRCSRCKSEWYCGRQCQVTAWKGHKPVCDILSTAGV